MSGLKKKPGRPERESTVITKKFADRLSDLVEQRKRAGNSQKEIASDIGVSSGILSEWCSDKKTPSIDALFKIAKFFNVSADWLIGLSDVSTHDPDIQNAHLVTGLSLPAIEVLGTFQKFSRNTGDRFTERADKYGKQYLDFYSSFITNPGIRGMLEICGARITSILEGDIEEDERTLFHDPKDVISFYHFQMEQELLKFTAHYFDTFNEKGL